MLEGCMVTPFLHSNLDLWEGYYQIPMRAADFLTTAIITPFGP
jgi:hypothetical protein